MSGINGIISANRVNKLVDRLIEMNKTISQTIHTEVHEIESNKIAFGHINLNISTPLNTLDTNKAVIYEKDEWIMLFDGEIYNISEIRKIDGLNENISDCEILINYIKKYGWKELLNIINGVFSIVLLDRKNKTIYLIRDHIGLKPLYYAINENKELIFSSNIKAILNSGLISPEFFEDAIDEYLAYRYIRPPYTFFKNIYQVDPAHILAINVDFNINKINYWELPKQFNMSTSFNEDQIKDEFHQKLIDTINKRLKTDLSIGTYLSGGVDSSFITALASVTLDKTIHTYTIGFEQLNEYEYSNKIAKQYNTNHHEILVQKDEFLQSMKNIISYKATPLGVPNEVPLFISADEMKKNISIVLTGEGADELLGGYGRIFRSPFEYEKKEQISSFYDYFINLYEYVPRKIRDEFLNTNNSIRDRFDEQIRNEFALFNNEANVFRFFHKYHVQGLLQRIDIATRSKGIIARAPFIDYKLIEFSYEKIPYDLKLRWKSPDAKQLAKNKSPKDYSENLDTPKYLLKKVGEKYLPNEILYRKKVGFPVPLNNWIPELEEMALNILMDAPWLNTEYLKQLLKELKQRPNAGQLLWMFVNIEIFRNEFFTKKWTW